MSHPYQLVIMKKGCLISIIVVLVLAVVFVISLFRAFEPQYDSAEIAQDVGGTLVCNSTYNADHHSWQYDVKYQYKTAYDSTINIGYGSYHGREWNKNEQLIKYKDWYILKTGNWGRSDKVLIGKLDSTKWIDYPFTPEKIEQNEIWKSKQIHSLLNWCCAETYVETIRNGEIIVEYKYRVSETETSKYGIRKVFYIIDEQTGMPVMYKIE